MGAIRKLALLAFLAVMAAAFVLPAAASASNWKDGGTAITSEATIPFSGTFGFSSAALGGMSCTEMHGQLVLTPGSTGHLTLSPTIVKCKGTGALSKCNLETILQENFPWTIHDEATFISITGFKTIYKFVGAGCPGLVTIEGSGMRATPNNTAAISSLTLSGQLSASSGGTPLGMVTASGTLTPTNPGDVGTYGL
jgi:hypothetical protein